MTRPRARLALGLLLAAACAGCGRPPVRTRATPPIDLPRLAADFQHLIHEGCYLCLRDVLDQYRALPARARQSPVLEPVAAQAALVFILRHKELGIPIDEEWREAQALAAAAAGTSPAALRHLQIAWAIPWNRVGVDEDFLDRDRHRWPSLEERSAWRDALQAEWPQSEVAAYLYVALNCELRPLEPIDLTPVRQHYPESPLVQYRWATCANAGESTLRSLLHADSRFQEIHFFLGRDAFHARQFDRAEAEDVLAWQGIPRFTAAALSVAGLALTAENFERALTFADDVLAIVPAKRDALLDKVTALSYLGRYADAVAAAHHLIDLGHWLLGDAYYWLSWNEYHLDTIDQALRDVQTTKQYETNVRVYMLAGLIRMKKTEWPDAKKEFMAALNVSPDACDAMFYLGGTNGHLSQWPEAASDFARAIVCYVAYEAQVKRQMAQASAENPAAGASFTARRIARLQEELRRATANEQSSTYNAAISFLTAGHPEEARHYAQQAEAFPPFAERARALLAKIDRAQQQDLDRL
jgi:tetratricopeptide (TPR) repeat protein